MYGPTAPRKRSRLRQVDLHEPVEERVGPRRVAGQQHQEVVVAVEELADLEQVAAEQADDRPIGAVARRCLAPFAEGVWQRPGRAGWRWPSTWSGRAPRGRCRVRRPRPAGSRPARSTGRRRASARGPGRSGRGAPSGAAPARAGPGGHLAGRAVGQRPVGPVARVAGRSRGPARSCRRRTGRARPRRRWPTAGRGRRRGSARAAGPGPAAASDRRWRRCPTSGARRSRSARCADSR